MPKISSLIRLTNLPVALSGLFILATLAGLWARTRAEGFKNAGSNESPSQTSLYKQRLRVWIHGDGLRPRIMHAKPGVVLFTCENKTLLNSELVLERMLPSGSLQAVGAVALIAERGRRTQEFLLAEGNYVVYERSRPDLKTIIVVSP